MPFLLILIGLVLVISAVRGTHRELGALVRGDFSGPNNFFIWLLAIGIVGSVGYINSQGARNFSRAFLALVLIAMLLSNKGFFSQLFGAFQNVQGGESKGSGAAGNTVGTQPSQEELQAKGVAVIQGWADAGASVDQITGAVNTSLGVAKTVGSFISNPIKSIGSLIGGLF